MSQTSAKKAFYIANPVTGWAQMPYNTKEVLTESGEWESPITGWIKVTCVGGGQAGASIRNNGSSGLRAVYFGAPGAATSFGPIIAKGGVSWLTAYGGGGAAGAVVTDYLPVTAGDKILYTIGTGGVATSVSWSGDTTAYSEEYPGSGTILAVTGVTPNVFNCVGGAGGSNGTAFGGGGGGAGYHLGSSSAAYPSHAPGAGAAQAGNFMNFGSSTPGTDVLGGDGGAGAVILEYANPKKKS